MTRNAVRIGRIRPKSGGDIHVLSPTPRTDVQQGLLESTLELLADLPDLAGFALIVWDEEGTPFCHSWAGVDGAGPVGPYLLPCFVHDAVLLHVMGDADVEDDEAGEDD